VLDYNEAGQVVGVEMRDLSRRSPQLDMSRIELQTA
jgi:hypothetical protein